MAKCPTCNKEVSLYSHYTVGLRTGWVYLRCPRCNTKIRVANNEEEFIRERYIG